MNRRQVEIPDRLYHVTKKEYVSQILLEGLQIGKNITGDCEDPEVEDDRIGIYLTSDFQFLLEIDPDLGILPRENLAVLQVDVSELKHSFIPDRAYDSDFDFTQEELAEGLNDQFCWISPHPISSNYIELMKEVDL